MSKEVSHAGFPLHSRGWVEMSCHFRPDLIVLPTGPWLPDSVAETHRCVLTAIHLEEGPPKVSITCTPLTTWPFPSYQEYSYLSIWKHVPASPQCS